MLRGEKDKVGRDDMVTLSSITEEEMLSNLKKRYADGMIYVYISAWFWINVIFQTCIGSVLISLNPYKELGVFSKKNIDKYKGKQAFEVRYNFCACLLLHDTK